MSTACTDSAISFEELETFCRNALMTTGMPEQSARLVAQALTTADAMGVVTHGTKLLAGYLRRLNAGGYRPDAIPKVEREGPSWAILDGQSSLGQVGSAAAMQLAIQKARTTGIAYVGLKDTGHIGAAGYYALMAAQAGMIGMVTGNDIPTVAAPGARKAVLGSNPLAYAIPVNNGDPILLDIATAAIAGGKVYAACQRGEPIPATWLIGNDGLPTTDGSLFPAQAALAPMAGHKGYALGLWCEILSAILPGGRMTWNVGSWMFDEPSLPSGHNASFIAFDVNTIGPGPAFEKRIRALIDQLHQTPTADGIERILIPGELEWKRYHQARATGIPLPRDVREKLSLAAQLTGIEAGWLL